MVAIHLSVATLVLSLSFCSSVDGDRTFLSGTADTTQYFQFRVADDDDGHVNLGSTFKRHHLVCFHRGDAHSSYASTIVEGRAKCCNELHQSGLLRRDSRKHCLDHVAVVPDVSGVSAGGKQGDEYPGDVAPAFYLAKDEEVTDSTKKSLTRSYNQVRQLKVYEDKDRETFRDGFNGVEALSPFHLTGFSDEAARKFDEAEVFPMGGKVVGALSGEGHHRAFHQKISLSLDGLSAASDKDYRMNTNATIFLPVTEDVFIDADDPLLVEDESGSPDEVYCRVSIDNEMIKSTSSTCDIRFLHPETIDIEQPSFASRQYIVAYQVNAMLELSFEPSSEGLMKELEVVVDYGTTLHLRYPPPISNENVQAANGLVPIAIQHPVLYSASMSLEGADEPNANIYYALKTDALEAILNPPDPIIVHVVAGLDSDYWWTTIITMTSAMIGGLILINSLDSVSTWC